MLRMVCSATLKDRISSSEVEEMVGLELIEK